MLLIKRTWVSAVDKKDMGICYCCTQESFLTLLTKVCIMMNNEHCISTELNKILS